jgi:hypothetical protein
MSHEMYEHSLYSLVFSSLGQLHARRRARKRAQKLKTTVATPCVRLVATTKHETRNSCSSFPWLWLYLDSLHPPLASVTTMASYVKEKRTCFEQIDALNRSDEEKTAAMFFKPILGFSSAVERVDQVTFLHTYMPFIGTHPPSVVDKSIRASFMALKQEQESPVPYKRFRDQLRLFCKVYFAFHIDPSQPTLLRNTDVPLLWEFLGEKLRDRIRMDGCKPSVSLQSCIDWGKVLPVPCWDTSSMPPPSTARATTQRRKRAEAPRGGAAPPPNNAATRRGGSKKATAASSGAVPEGGNRRRGRRQQAVTAESNEVELGGDDASTRDRTTSPGGGSSPNESPHRDVAAPDKAVDGDQTPTNDGITDPDARPHRAAAESNGKVIGDDVQPDVDEVIDGDDERAELAVPWDDASAANYGNVEEEDELPAKDTATIPVGGGIAERRPHSADAMFGKSVETANTPETDRATINSDGNPRRAAADEAVDETTANHRALSSSGGRLAASTNVAAMSGMQQRLPSHPYHRWTQGGEAFRVQIGEQHNIVQRFDPGTSGLPTPNILFGRPNEDSTPSDSPLHASDLNSSSASPNHAHVAEGAPELVNEAFEPLLGSRPSRAADQAVERGHSNELGSDTHDDTAGTRCQKHTHSSPIAATKKRKRSSGAASESATPSHDDAMVPLDTRGHRAKYKIEDGDVTRVWNDTETKIEQLRTLTQCSML